MSELSHDDAQRRIDAYFKGGADRARMADTFAHLSGCEDCRDYFNRREMIADIDPKAATAMERVGNNLGLGSALAKQRSVFRFAPAFGAAAAVVVVAVILPTAAGPEGDGFAARGGDASDLTAKISVFEVTGDRSQPVAGSVDANAALAFTYTNPQAQDFVMIFGIDSQGSVYWYHPVWTDAEQNPRAVRADDAPGVHELQGATRHGLQDGELQIRALFTNEPLGVREVEKAVADGRLKSMGQLVDVGKLNVKGNR